METIFLPDYPQSGSGLIYLFSSKEQFFKLVQDAGLSRTGIFFLALIFPLALVSVIVVLVHHDKAYDCREIRLSVRGVHAAQVRAFPDANCRRAEHALRQLNDPRHTRTAARKHNAS